MFPVSINANAASICNAEREELPRLKLAADIMQCSPTLSIKQNRRDTADMNHGGLYLLFIHIQG